MSTQTPDFITCPICRTRFNGTNKKPISLLCGHTCCSSCLHIMHRKQCPLDATPFNQVGHTSFSARASTIRPKNKSLEVQIVVVILLHWTLHLCFRFIFKYIISLLSERHVCNTPLSQEDIDSFPVNTALLLLVTETKSEDKKPLQTPGDDKVRPRVNFYCDSVLIYSKHLVQS